MFPEQVEILSKLVALGVERAASSLSDMASERVELCVPAMRALSNDDLAAVSSDERRVSVVDQGFCGKLCGRGLLVFPRAWANSLVTMLAPSESSDVGLEAERETVVTEVGNHFLNGVLGSFASVVGGSLEFGLPRYREVASDQLPSTVGVEPTTVVTTVSIGIRKQFVGGQFVLAFDATSMRAVFDDAPAGASERR